MSISRFPTGSIIEDLKSNSIYEITGTVISKHNHVEYYRYTVKTLVNPLDLKVKIINITTVDELSLIHFFNVEAIVRPSNGLVDFILVNMYEEDSLRLVKINIFIENYFDTALLYTKGKNKYRVELEDVDLRTVKVTRLSNIFEKILFKKDVVFKIIPITELFEEYKVRSFKR